MSAYEALGFVIFMILLFIVYAIIEYFMLKRTHKKLQMGEWQIEGNG